MLLCSWNEVAEHVTTQEVQGIIHIVKSSFDIEIVRKPLSEEMCKLPCENCYDYKCNYAMMRPTSAGIQLIIFVACPRLGGRNWKLLASPCIPNSSSAFKWLRPGPCIPSSTVVSVDDDPLSIPSLLLSWRATRKIFEADRIIDALDEFAKVSLIRSCRPS